MSAWANVNFKASRSCTLWKTISGELKLLEGFYYEKKGIFLGFHKEMKKEKGKRWSENRENYWFETNWKAQNKKKGWKKNKEKVQRVAWHKQQSKTEQIKLGWMFDCYKW